jgi:glycosyltransferase involved in cell wall biosynthesis
MNEAVQAAKTTEAGPATAAPPPPAPPLVSIVISSFNPGEHLRVSVESALGQTWENIEVIVVDDGSTDGSIAAIEKIGDPRLRILRQPNSGKSVAMNRALTAARGEFYAIQDADDVSDPRRIERQVQRLLQDPSLAAVFCGHELILKGRSVAPRFCEKTPEDCRRDIQAWRMPAHDPTVMFRLSAVRGIEYDPALRIGQGYDYVLRVGERHPMAVIGESLYRYRVHPNSITRQGAARRQKAVVEVLRRAANRRGVPFTEDFASGIRIKSGRNAELDNNLAAHFIESVRDLRRAGRRREAISVGLCCAALHPFDPHYFKALVYGAMPEAFIDRLRRDGRRTTTGDVHG